MQEDIKRSATIESKLQQAQYEQMNRLYKEVQQELDLPKSSTQPRAPNGLCRIEDPDCEACQ